MRGSLSLERILEIRDGATHHRRVHLSRACHVQQLRSVRIHQSLHLTRRLLPRLPHSFMQALLEPLALTLVVGTLAFKARRVMRALLLYRVLRLGLELLGLDLVRSLRLPSRRRRRRLHRRLLAFGELARLGRSRVCFALDALKLLPVDLGKLAALGLQAVPMSDLLLERLLQLHD